MRTKINTGISTRIVLLGVALLVAASSVVASATVNVTNITMQKLSQFTELTIVCDGPAIFEHQIVKATADKPYRIVVDVKGAEHMLPQHNFSALPSGMIQRIRTSQYSTVPHVVRVVIDASGKLTYKVKDGTKSISLHIATPDDDNFTLWSAVPVSQTPELATATVVDEVAGQPTKPAKMPAIEGNEANAPKVDYNDPAKKDLRLGSKPPIEVQEEVGTQQPKQDKKEVKHADVKSGEEKKAKVSEDASKEIARDKTTEVAEPTSVPETLAPDLLSFVYGETPAESADAASGKSAAASKPKNSSGASMPKEQKSSDTESAKNKDMVPPKVEKSSLPDTKAAAKPELAKNNAQDNDPETTDSPDDNLGAVADALANEPVDQNSDDSADKEARSKSERVREKYRSNLDKQDSQGERGESQMAGKAQSSSEPKSKIERIREKYKRGIKFAIDEQDERRQEYLDEKTIDQSAGFKRNVGPYSEFLPEREIVVYNSGGRVDPFAPMIEDAIASSEPQRLPDVEALRLVGVLLDDGDDRGLFQDFNGYYYILREGDSVKNGYLLSITEDRATFQIRQYGWNRQVALDLENKF